VGQPRFVRIDAFPSRFVGRRLVVKLRAHARHPVLSRGASPHPRKRVHDPTSGFVGVNRRALEVYSRSVPLEYPEIEALIVYSAGARFQQAPCKMYARVAGRASITRLKSFYYIAHVLLGGFINVLKYERRPRRSPDADAGG